MCSDQLRVNNEYCCNSTGTITAPRGRFGQTYNRLVNGRNGASVSVHSMLVAAADTVQVIDIVVHTVKQSVRQVSGSDR
jgi:hypothetical protein